MPTFAAVDVGASGGRVVAGTIDHEGIRLQPVHRFANGVHDRAGRLRWDFTAIMEEVRTGLDSVPEAVSIGIDTWGVDYGLLDDAGHLLAEPVSYRDNRTADVIDEVHALVSPDRMFAVNGLQFLPFTTLYQLVAEQTGPLWANVAHVVLLPDLVAHDLTGRLGAEVTNASTTGLLDARRRQWSTDLLTRLGIPKELLLETQEPGAVRGITAGRTSVVTVGSHDTASAVAGVPAVTERFAYVVSGTWSLVGLELTTPVLTQAVRSANFSNEAGIDGTTRFLRNVGGLWLLQECLRAWGRADVDSLVDEAACLPSGGPLVDIDDPAFIPPGRMPQRIAVAAGRPDLTVVETVRCIVDSLAAGYASTIQEATSLTGALVEVVHMVGGGSRSSLLCQATADALQLPVLAGPIEASALGNILVQARAAGLVPSDLMEARACLAASTTPVRYEPR